MSEAAVNGRREEALGTATESTLENQVSGVVYDTVALPITKDYTKIMDGAQLGAVTMVSDIDDPLEVDWNGATGGYPEPDDEWWADSSEPATAAAAVPAEQLLRDETKSESKETERMRLL